MRYGSLFSGVGGFDEGLDRAGWECAFQVELDPFCTRVLAERWPDVRRWNDVRRLTDEQLRETSGLIGSERGAAQLDLLVGGFPCQGASVAGKRLGLADDRTALFWEIIRIQQIVRAPWALLENVPGLRSVRFGHDFAICLAALKELWPVVGWRTFDSRFFHVAQRRERVFFVCGPTEAGVASVLFEPEGGGGHSTAGGEAGAGVTGPLGGGAYGTGRRDEDDPNRVLARCVASGSRYDGDTETFLIADTTQITSAKNYSNPKAGDTGHPLAEGAHPPLLVSGLLAKTNGGWRMGADEAAGGMLTVTHALSAEGHDAGEDGTGRGTPLVVRDERGRSADGTVSESAWPLHAAKGQSEQQSVQWGSLVRRLTPLECERLQHFPDGWTCLCQPLTAYATDPDAAALTCTCPDSPRYRALGNAVTVSVIEWLGRRLMAQVAPR